MIPSLVRNSNACSSSIFRTDPGCFIERLFSGGSSELLPLEDVLSSESSSLLRLLFLPFLFSFLFLLRLLSRF
jgi:hypothetical protein